MSHDGIAIVYPAVFPTSHAESHCTAIFLGRIGEVHFTKDMVLYALWDIQRYWGRNIHRYFRANSELEMFGVAKDKPVVTFRDDLVLRVCRDLIDKRLAEEGIKSASEFTNYRPHVTLEPGALYAPLGVTLLAPILWWGNERGTDEDRARLRSGNASLPAENQTQARTAGKV
jgi:hypothetical protein